MADTDVLKLSAIPNSVSPNCTVYERSAAGVAGEGGSGDGTTKVPPVPVAAGSG
jgi:hypothetical protein